MIVAPILQVSMSTRVQWSAMTELLTESSSGWEGRTREKLSCGKDGSGGCC